MYAQNKNLKGKKRYIITYIEKNFDIKFTIKVSIYKNRMTLKSTKWF